MSATTAPRTLRIGEVAELTGVTPRTIRYYEEIGLLGGGAERVQGKHRLYTEADVERTAHASLIAELADRVSEERHPLDGLYELTVMALER